MIKFFKYFSAPLIIFAGILIFSSYMAWKEFKIHNDLIDESLAGNQFAIEILIKHKKPWKLNERLVYQALNGNVHALKVLQAIPEER